MHFVRVQKDLLSIGGNILEYYNTNNQYNPQENVQYLSIFFQDLDWYHEALSEKHFPKLYDGEKLKNSISEFLKDIAYENEDQTLSFYKLKKPISFKEALELVGQLNEIFKVSYFKFDTLGDSWYRTQPSLNIGLISGMLTQEDIDEMNLELGY